MKNLALSLLVLSALASPTISFAQWQPGGVPLCTSPGEQSNPTIIPDGGGGWIVAWYDDRDGDFSYDIYAQRIDASGMVLWQTNGLPVCTATGSQYSPVLVADGSGGAIVAWTDYRNNPSDSDVYAQHINAAGVAQWTTNGIVVGAATGEAITPVGVSDGFGGAILVWSNYNSADFDLFAQRVNASGVVQWTTNGVALAAGPGDQDYAVVTTDGAGGAIVSWSSAASDVFVQRINASGVVQWTANGVLLTAVSGSQYLSQMVSDGAGGAIVTWIDRRNTDFDIFAQRVNAGGIPQWTPNGVALCTAPSDQVYPTIATDGSSGAIVTWYDYRGGSSTDVYAQRVDALGNTRWANNGVPLCTAAGVQQAPTIVSDQSGGAIVAWQDSRGPGGDVYAQRVNAAGTAQWDVDGVDLSPTAGPQVNPVIAPGGAGGPAVAWTDYRVPFPDIYVQRVEKSHGYTGHPEPVLTSVMDIRPDQGGKVKVNWKASDLDVPNNRTITHYSVWRATDAVTAQAAAVNGELVKSPSAVKSDFKGRAVWMQRVAATDYYWEWVGNQDAHYLTAYTFSSPTRADSTAQGVADAAYFVSAHTADAFVFYDSNIMSGHSVDNLAPAAPLFLTAQRVASDVHLKWSRVHVSDLKNYSVYRKTSSGVTPIPANFLATDTDTVLVDASAPTSALYYIVTATDVHQNQGKQSNEANVSAATNVGNLPPITALTVLQNRPNPFTSETELEIGLPAAESIHIDVYDVAGRRVRTKELTGVKGWQQIALAGVDERGAPLASGVYFYKVHAGGETLTRKMLIAR